MGFYGMDLYSLTESADSVVSALQAIDPEAARRTRERFRCVEPYRDRPEAYGEAAASRASSSCQDEAAAVWTDLQRTPGAAPAGDAALFHEAGVPSFLLVFRGNQALQSALAGPRLERAGGVLYLPETERASHYFNASLSRGFDAVIHIDSTHAVAYLR